MCEGGVRGWYTLGSYKKLGVGMFEGVLKDEAGAGHTEELGSVKVIILFVCFGNKSSLSRPL